MKNNIEKAVTPAPPLAPLGSAPRNVFHRASPPPPISSPSEPAVEPEPVPATRLSLAALAEINGEEAQLASSARAPAKKRLFVSKKTFSSNSPHFGKGEPIIEWGYHSITSDTGSDNKPRSARGAPTYKKFWGSRTATRKSEGVVSSASTSPQKRSMAQKRIETSSDSDDSYFGEPQEQQSAAPLAQGGLFDQSPDRYSTARRQLHSAPAGALRSAMNGSGGVDEFTPAASAGFANRYRRTVESLGKQNASKVGKMVSPTSSSSGRDDAKRRIAWVRKQSVGHSKKHAFDASSSSSNDDGSSSVSSTSTSFSDDDSSLSSSESMD